MLIITHGHKSLAISLHGMLMWFIYNILTLMTSLITYLQIKEKFQNMKIHAPTIIVKLSTYAQG